MKKKNRNKKNDPNQVIDRQKDLKHYMQNEINLLREILGHMKEEQHHILMNNAEELKRVTKERDLEIDHLTEARKLRILSIRNLALAVGCKLTTTKDGVSFEELSKLLINESDESYEIVSLRDTTVTLLDKIRDLSSSNNYLLESKITLTKKLISNLGPKESNPTYGSNGGMITKVKTKTLTLINHEV